MTEHHTLAGIPLRAARWSATHPWQAIVAWFAFVAVAFGLAFAVPTQETTDADYRLGESGRASAMVAAAGISSPDTETVLITPAADGPLDTTAARAAASELSGTFRTLPEVASVAAPLWNPDHTALLVDVELVDGTDDVTALQDATADVRARYADLSLREAGDISTDAGIDDQVAEDLSAAEGFSLPVTLVLMLLAFGALIAAGIPVLLAVTSVLATMGLSAPLSHLLHAEPTVASMIVLIGMAVGVDYSLFYLKREREEREAGATTLDAVEIAAATSGHSIVVSGGAVIASMAGLFIFGGATFNSLASGAIVVVAVAVVGSITVLPALLVKLGRWVDRPRLPLLWRLNRRIGHGGISRRLLGTVLRRPAVSLVGAAVVLGLLALPALGMKLHSANLETLPGSIPEVATWQRLADEFPSQGTTASVVVRGQAEDRDRILAALGGLERSATADSSFVSVGQDAITTSRDGSTSVLRIGLPYDESDPGVDTALTRLRTELVPAAVSGLDVDAAVGGDAAESLDFVNRQHDRMPLVIGFVLLLTLVMMAASFRSLPIALISTALNLLSVGVAFGILTLVFQDGWLAGPLGFTSPGFVIDWIPLFVMVILVGLSMDYHVFVLGRVREYVRLGMPAQLAVRRGISETAGVVTSAAAVMVSVFAIFATLSMLEMKMMGVALSAAILIDATLIRLVILPAVLVLLGDRAWWPTRPTPPPGEPVVVNESPATVVPVG